MHYNKPPLSISQQIGLLESRGLVINDKLEAESYLNNISYYRLSAYMLPFQIVGTEHTFSDNTQFKQIIDLYTFDRQLKLLIFDAIERIEIAIRTQIIYQLSLKYGGHWQNDETIFKDSKTFESLQEEIETYCQQGNREVFIDHYLNKYTIPPTPPSWMSIEIITMGQLSKTYKSLKEKTDKKEIADYFGLFPIVFESWIHTTTYIRNICAHHARLWNRDLGVQPVLLLRPKKDWISVDYNNNRRIYYFLCCLRYMLYTVNPTTNFTLKVKELLKKNPNVPSQYMGFPSNWQNEPLWQK
jgi:abortive infection bacteriophage resistance protein